MRREEEGEADGRCAMRATTEFVLSPFSSLFFSFFFILLPTHAWIIRNSSNSKKFCFFISARDVIMRRWVCGLSEDSATSCLLQYDVTQS